MFVVEVSGVGGATMCSVRMEAHVLDWSAFPCLSRRHIQKCRQAGGLKVLPQNDIWNNARELWNKELPNCKIASGYIRAYRVADKVIRAKGSNSFLRTSRDSEGIHTGVNTDFYSTDNGMERKDGTKKISASMVYHHSRFNSLSIASLVQHRTF